MSAPDPISDAMLALRLLSLDPKGLGGAWLKGGAGPLRDALLENLRLWLPKEMPVRRVPVSIDDQRLIGGIDLGATLAAGRPVHHAGLLAELRNGVMIVPGAERAGETLTGRLAQAMDEGGPVVLLLDEGGEEDGAPAALVDRVAFHLRLEACVSLPSSEPIADAPSSPLSVTAEPAMLDAIGRLAEVLGVRSSRTVLFALRAARAHAALNGRDRLEEGDVEVAARLVLAPSATRLPPAADDPPPASHTDDRPQETGEAALEDVVLAAVRASLPDYLLERLAAGRTRSGGRTQQGSGARKRTKLRGRPVGSRAGVPGGGLRLALIDTLRTAAPWQQLRERGAGKIVLRKDDLRVRRYEDRETALTIFAVDASGSAAFARLAEAKGAVELLLQRAYARRAEVALIAFRGEGAELLLPPTRSLTRARRLLADLPGGGATPLAAGLDAARELGKAARQRGRTPQLVVMTDGRGNVAADGVQSRQRGAADALTAARRIAGTGINGVVIDIGARPQAEARALADAMAARLVHLPRADAADVRAAVAA